MTVSTNNLAVSTDQKRINEVFDKTLGTLRITGNLLLREVYGSPWAVSVPGSQDLSLLLDTPPDVLVVAFHLVEFGHCLIETEAGETHHLRAGDMAICFGGQAHRLSQGHANPAGTALGSSRWNKTDHAQPIESLLRGEPNLHRPDRQTEAEQSALICGAFLLTHTDFNPLMSALPPVMHADLSARGQFNNLTGAAQLMAREIDHPAPGSGYIIERLLEILCAEAIRSHIENQSDSGTSWFRGIKDEVVGKALAAIHENPGEAWTVPRLAAQVAMSPSRFAARFSESIGDSPMSYVTKWRMNVACRDLLQSRRSLDHVAESIGYESTTAFSRAFKKHLGVSPAVWRRQSRSPETTTPPNNSSSMFRVNLSTNQGSAG